MSATKLESVRIEGFRSLADVELSGLGGATVMLGANGSGKSNFIRFFEMTSWMLRSRRFLAGVAERPQAVSDPGGRQRPSRYGAEQAHRGSDAAIWNAGIQQDRPRLPDRRGNRAGRDLPGVSAVRRMDKAVEDPRETLKENPDDAVKLLHETNRVRTQDTYGTERGPG